MLVVGRFHGGRGDLPEGTGRHYSDEPAGGKVNSTSGCGRFERVPGGLRLGGANASAIYRLGRGRCSALTHE